MGRPGEIYYRHRQQEPSRPRRRQMRRRLSWNSKLFEVQNGIIIIILKIRNEMRTATIAITTTTIGKKMAAVVTRFYRFVPLIVSIERNVTKITATPTAVTRQQQQQLRGYHRHCNNNNNSMQRKIIIGNNRQNQKQNPLPYITIECQLATVDRVHWHL